MGVLGFILSVDCDGYKILFVIFLFFKVIFNNFFVVIYSYFVFEVIFDLLRVKCVDILDCKLDIVNLFFIFI